MCIQCVQIAPRIIVPNRPTYKPAFLNASGMANIPVPMLPTNLNVNRTKLHWQIAVDLLVDE